MVALYPLPVVITGNRAALLHLSFDNKMLRGDVELMVIVPLSESLKLKMKSLAGLSGWIKLTCVNCPKGILVFSKTVWALAVENLQ